MEFSQLTFSAALPEFFLIALALVMVLVAAFARQTQAEEQGTIKLVRTLSLLGYFAAFLAVFSVPDGRIVLFNDLFAVNELVIYMKGLILVGAFFASWLVSEQWGEGIDRAEFHLLVLMAVIGMLLMVSANDLISLYMALELQSLAPICGRGHAYQLIEILRSRLEIFSAWRAVFRLAVIWRVAGLRLFWKHQF